MTSSDQVPAPKSRDLAAWLAIARHSMHPVSITALRMGANFPLWSPTFPAIKCKAAGDEADGDSDSFASGGICLPTLVVRESDARLSSSYMNSPIALAISYFAGFMINLTCNQ